MHIINVNVHGNIGKGSLVIITSLVAIHLFLRSDKFTVCPDIKFGADIGDDEQWFSMYLNYSTKYA